MFSLSLSLSLLRAFSLSLQLRNSSRTHPIGLRDDMALSVFEGGNERKKKKAQKRKRGP